MSYKIDKTYALSGPEGDSRKTSNKFIILHDVGVSTGAAANASYFKHNWNSASAYTAFVVGDGGKVFQVGTPGYVQWGAGSTANAQSPVQIELGRTTSKSQFKKDYAAYIELARDMAKKYSIPLTLDAGGASTPGVKTHRWVTDHIWGSHVDPYGYLSSMGISKAQLQHDIVHGVSGSATTTTKSKPSTSGSTYTVKKGDSWWKIATDHKTTVAKLTALNGKKATAVIHPGDKIKLSGSVGHTYYTVKKGDSLWAIATAHKITVAKLCSLNGFTSKHVIHPGDKVAIK